MPIAGERFQMLDFKYRVFLSVARHLSFSKAARELSLTQPAVSFQVANLEADLKVRLFVRFPKRIELTPIGELLCKEVAGLERRTLRARENIMRRMKKYWGTLVMGASTTIGNFFLPPVLARFKEKYPEVPARIMVDNTDQVLTYLVDGIIDFAIVEGPVNRKPVVTEKIFTDELVVIVPPGFHGAETGTISPKQLSGLSFISREAGSGTRAVVDGLRIRNRPLIPPSNIILELGSSTAIKKGVEGGIGVSIVSAMTLANELKLGTLKALRIEKFPIHRDISSCVSKGREQTAAVKDFLKMCKEHGNKIVSVGK